MPGTSSRSTSLNVTSLPESFCTRFRLSGLALCMLSRTVTSCPSWSISSTVWLPMKPAPPVTRTFIALTALCDVPWLPGAPGNLGSNQRLHHVLVWELVVVGHALLDGSFRRRAIRTQPRGQVRQHVVWELTQPQTEPIRWHLSLVRGASWREGR